MAARWGGSPYGLTKNTVEHMTRGMAAEVGDAGITVNCIAPGHLGLRGAPRPSRPTPTACWPASPSSAWARSRDLYDAMAFLCSPGGLVDHGPDLRVDGGAALP